MDYLKVANDPMLWLMCAPVVLLVLIQAALFGKKAWGAASIAGVTELQCKQALRVGAISAIGPSMAVFVVFMGMIAIVGAPITWQRLNIIGAAPTELTATNMGAVAWGANVGTEEYGLMGFATSVWAMSLNGCGWLLFSGLFTHKLNYVISKITGGSMAIMAIVCGAAVLGTSSYLAVNQSIQHLPNFVAVTVGAAAMAVLQKYISPNHPKLREWNLGIAMLCGMTAATLLKIAAM